MQDPVANAAPALPLWGLVAVLLVAALSVVVWVWAVRRPAIDPSSLPVEPEPEARPLRYIALGNTDIAQFFPTYTEASSAGWAAILHTYLPPNTLSSSADNRSRTISEAVEGALSDTVAAQPDIVTLWTAVSDSTSGTPLTEYLRDLRVVLDRLTGETDAQVVLPNMPDVTLMMQDASEERKELVRGGVAQWNRVIAEVASRYGSRVRVVDLYPHSEAVLNPSTGNTFLAGAIKAALDL